MIFLVPFLALFGLLIAFLVAGIAAAILIAALIGLLAAGGGLLRRQDRREVPSRTDAEARRERIALIVTVVLLLSFAVTGLLLLTFS